MTTSLILCCFWVVIATGIACLPVRYTWWGAYGLIAVGIPLVGWVTYQNGPLVGMLVLAGGASMLRWPIVYLTRWVKRLAAGRAE